MRLLLDRLQAGPKAGEKHPPQDDQPGQPVDWRAETAGLERDDACRLRLLRIYLGWCDERKQAPAIDVLNVLTGRVSTTG